MPLPLMVFESIKERGCDYKEMFGARCEEHKSAALCEVHQEGYLSPPEEPTVTCSYSKLQIPNFKLHIEKQQDSAVNFNAPTRRRGLSKVYLTKEDSNLTR